MVAKNKPDVETIKGELVITRIFDAPRELVWKAGIGTLGQLANYLTKQSKEVS